MSTVELPNTSSAPRLSRWPSMIDTLAAAPAPMSTPIAALMFITGNVMANPAIASAPTPRPMNIRSITLYSDITTIPTIAGMLYSHSRRPIGRVDKSDMDFCS